MSKDTEPHRKPRCRVFSKRWRRFLAVILGIVIFGAGRLAQADTVTTLTGLPGGPPFNLNVPVNHGSNAEVTLTWDTNWDQYGTAEFAGGWDGRGNVYQMEFDTQTITFAPTAGNIKVTIVQLFLDEWSLGGNTSSDWTVTGSSSGVLASGTWDEFNNLNDPNDEGGRSLVSLNAAGLPGETLTLLFSNLDAANGGGLDSNLAMDNLTFSTAIVPEPATFTMMWLGAAALSAMATRRKRN